jgi:hypothetical protein
MVKYVSPTTDWVAAEVDIDADVSQEQLQRIPAGPPNLTAETFELIQRAHNYPTRSLLPSYDGLEPHVIPRDKRHLRFRVHFRGLPDTHDRMYPWAQLASNPQLHASSVLMV